MNKKKVVKWVLRIVLLSLMVFAIISYFTNGIVYSLFRGDIETLSEIILNRNLAIFIFILIVMLEVVIAPIPALILYIVGGVVFGPLLGGTLSLIGNLLGAALAFQLSRNWARKYFEKKVTEKMKRKFDNFSLRYGSLAIFFLRLNPLTSSDIFSYIAGLSKMNFWKFLIGTGLGLTPLVYFQSYMGGLLKDNVFLMELFILISALYVIGFILVFFYIQFRKDIREKKENAKLSQNEKR